MPQDRVREELARGMILSVCVEHNGDSLLWAKLPGICGLLLPEVENHCRALAACHLLTFTDHVESTGKITKAVEATTFGTYVIEGLCEPPIALRFPENKIDATKLRFAWRWSLNPLKLVQLAGYRPHPSNLLHGFAVLFLYGVFAIYATELLRVGAAGIRLNSFLNEVGTWLTVSGTLWVAGGVIYAKPMRSSQSIKEFRDHVFETFEIASWDCKIGIAIFLIGATMQAIHNIPYIKEIDAKPKLSENQAKTHSHQTDDSDE